MLTARPLKQGILNRRERFQAPNKVFLDNRVYNGEGGGVIAEPAPEFLAMWSMLNLGHQCARVRSVFRRDLDNDGKGPVVHRRFVRERDVVRAFERSLKV
jgi:hypothetical protein